MEMKRIIILLMLSAIAMGMPMLLMAQASAPLVITEIMSDPSPARSLPDAEYIELTNPGSDTIALNGWKLGMNDNEVALPDEVIAPGAFLIITRSAAASHFLIFGQVAKLNSMPALTNDGGSVYLRSPDGNIVHFVQYSSAMHDNPVKRAGGWSLEMINISSACNTVGNWKSSEDELGGTPGRRNSVDQNTLVLPLPTPVAATMPDSVHVEILFTGKIRLNAPVTTSVIVDEGSNMALTAFITDSTQTKLLIRLRDPINENEPLLISLFSFSDCSGRPLPDGINIQTGKSSIPLPSSIVINEIMFNPASPGKDYVELFNNSAQIIDLGDLHVGSRISTGALQIVSRLHNEPMLLMPGGYVVFTEDSSLLRSEFRLHDSISIIELGDLPTLPDDSGSIVIINERGNIIDEVHYHKQWHISLLANDDGIALERINPSIASDIPSNWTSASTILKGTPGWKNSQYASGMSVISKSSILIDHPIFSPDGDGHEDLLFVHYDFGSPRTMLSIKIYTASAQIVKTLVNNQLMPMKGQVKWDGATDDNKTLPAGLYILQAMAFNSSGKKIKYTRAITLARKGSP